MFRVRRFITTYANLKLHTYFQLPYDHYQKFVITMHIENLTTIFVYFTYTKVSHCPSFNLPPELVKHIKQYLPEHNFIHLKLTIPQNYPFDPHHWELVHTNIHGSTQLIDDINCLWSPAITIEKDILVISEKILSIKT
jgi:hypothetical protein